jgi:hypothetical protein
MKYLIPFVVACLLTACDPTPDTNAGPAAASAAGGNATAVASAPASESEKETAASEEPVVPSGRVIRAGIFKAV